MYELLGKLRVIEGAAFVAAPSCGLYLAQFGAEVIRFDQIGGGPDYFRWPLAPGGASFYWEGLNKGKKSIAIDLTTSAGRELAVAVVCAAGETAGLLVTNYPPHGFLSYQTLRAAREDIISVRVMGWPDGSPALDYTVNAAAGLPLMTGPVDHDAPVNHVLPAWDLLCGCYAAFALLAAERDRRETGAGREIRIPLSDLAAATLSNLGCVAEVMSRGVDRGRFGNDLYGAFGRDFMTASGCRVMVCAITSRQWSALVTALDLGEAVAALESRLDVAFASDESARFQHRRELFALFEPVFASRSIDSLAAALDAAGVTWSRYQSVHTAVTTDARLFTGNPLFERVAQPSGFDYPSAGPPATLVGTARRPLAPAPRLGQHTDEILASVLGLSAAAIGRLHDAGVVSGPEAFA
jgi:2-methylfumaryl-CoA isomerase